MTARQKSRRTKYADDPMVSLVPTHLRAAMDQSGLTPSQLAKRLGTGENRQTIHHLASGDAPLKCRRSRRRQLSKVLQVPEAWLSGDQLELPTTGWAQLEAARWRSPRVLLAMARLMERCKRACERDLMHYTVEPQGVEYWSQAEEVLSYIAWAVGQLSNPLQWRHTLLKNKEERRPLTRAEQDYLRSGKAPGLDTIERMSPAEESASLALINAIDVILSPWFAGKADLRYDHVENLIAAIARGARLMYPSTNRPKAIITEDGRRLSPSDPSTPYALIHWPEKKIRHGAKK